MARLEFRNFANRKALAALPKGLLKRLLKPHEAYCDKKGLDIEALKDQHPATNEALFIFFSAPDPDMPEELLAALHRVDDLATTHGLDLIVDNAPKQGVDLSRMQEDLSPLGLALAVYLDHRPLFSCAHDRQSIEKAQRVQEYAAAEDRELSLDEAKKAIPAIEAQLRPFFKERRRSEFCKIRAYPEDGEIAFVVTHGRPYRTDGAVDKGLSESQVSYRPLKDDVVKYDNRTYRLKISASTVPTKLEYRKVFAARLFDDPLFFGEDKVVTLEPLLSLGRGALTPTRGIKGVELVEVRWQIKNSRRTVLTLSSDDVLSELEEIEGLRLGMGELIYAKLMVRYESGGRKRKVELKLPNQVIYNRGRDPGATKEFLEKRGFYVPRAAQEAEPA